MGEGRGRRQGQASLVHRPWDPPVGEGAARVEEGGESHFLGLQSRVDGRRRRVSPVREGGERPGPGLGRGQGWGLAWGSWLPGDSLLRDVQQKRPGKSGGV